MDPVRTNSPHFRTGPSKCPNPASGTSESIASAGGGVRVRLIGILWGPYWDYIGVILGFCGPY